jgi:hypothetical protein
MGRISKERSIVKERRGNMKEKFAKLINVKSIVTILLTLVVCYLSIAKGFDIKEIYLMIIAFYFGTQLKENKTESEGK